MRSATRLALTTIVITSTACSSLERISLKAPPADEARLRERAWKILERIELGALHQARSDIANLAARFPHDPKVASMQKLLQGWLERKQQAAARAADGEVEAPPETVAEEAVAGPPGPDADAPPPGPTGPAPELSPAAAEALKQQGIQLYSEGKVAAALACWHRVLASLPDDEEARQLASRAETVLRNQGAP